MAGKVFFSVTMSLDGFIAPEERTDEPDAKRWMGRGWNCEPVGAEPTQRATHLTYAVRER